MIRNSYFVYMLASRRHGTVYVGVTNNLARRVHEHKTKQVGCFTAAYGVERLVWYEEYERVVEAIAREKALKKCRRDWKVRLIEEFNPEWADLYPMLAGWIGGVERRRLARSLYHHSVIPGPRSGARNPEPQVDQILQDADASPANLGGSGFRARLRRPGTTGCEMDVGSSGSSALIRTPRPRAG